MSLTRNPDRRPQGLSARLCRWQAPCFMAALLALGVAQTQAATPIGIPLQHIESDGEGEGFDTLGIFVGINGSKPRVFELDTGSDEFNAQIDAQTPGIAPTPGSNPGMYAYGDGSYGYWLQSVRFDRLSYYDPADLSRPVATFDGGFTAAQVLDYVYTGDYDGLKNLDVSSKPVGTHNGAPLYADMGLRRKIQGGQPVHRSVLYGIFGVGDNIGSSIGSSAIGGRTKSGYVISANANMGDKATPGCAPCLILNLTPAIRSQFSAVMPWGKLDYTDEDYLAQFPVSGANASNMDEGAYSYSFSFEVAGKKRTVDFKGPILFDSGTSDFVYPNESLVIKRLKAKGFDLKENTDGKVDLTIGGFGDSTDDLEFDDVVISRLSDEADGNGVIIGLPFFQSNAVMYDLENRATAYSPYFVSAQDFTTGPAGNLVQLGQVTSEMGSGGWLGLAGGISGEGDFRVLKKAIIRLTGLNTYTGKTLVDVDGFLHLAGPGSIARSSGVMVEGVLNIEQKGNHLPSWGVADAQNDAVIRNLNGSGTVYLGPRRLVLTAASGNFSGSISDVDDADGSQGGGVVLTGGNLTLSGKNTYTGVTEIGTGAQLHVTGTLAGDVSVAGTLVVDGEVSGQVTVAAGGTLRGSGKTGRVTVAEGGTSTIAPRAAQ